ncbi:MAG: NAD(+) synthase, partial [Solobacterium sp.]|nr:NAD(+) synthase [Solobacterium sp.]
MMKNRMIKIGAAVPSLKVADVTTNTANIVELIREHRDCGILVFPELCLSGYTCGDLFFQRLLLQECSNGMEKIRELSKEIPDTTI